MMDYKSVGARTRSSRVVAFGKGGFLTVLAFFLFACTAHEKPSTVETALANVAKDIVIPIETENLKNPLPGNQQVVSQGQQIYLQSCAVCHGMDGHGATTWGRVCIRRPWI
jgi:cytochrome c5